MAVKFSDFTQKSDATASSVTEIVGYLSSGQLNVRVVPSALDTTYTLATTNGSTPVLTLAGTKTGETIADTVVTLSSSGGTTLSGSSTNAIAIDSVTYALEAGTKAGDLVPINLNASGSFTDSVVNLKQGSNITLTQNSATEIEISSTGGGGGGGVTSVGLALSSLAAFQVSNSPITSTGDIGLTVTGGSAGQYLDYQGNWSTPAGGGSFNSFNITGDSGTTENVTDGQTVTIVGGTLMGTVGSTPDTITVNHDSVTRTDTTSTDSPAAGGTVDLVKTITTSTEGHVTAVDVSTVTWPAGGAPTISKTQLTGNNSTTVFALTGAPAGLTVANLNIFISGVYQNQKDSGGTDNYSVGSGASPNLTFVTAPPVTAANGIDVVITS